MNNHLCTLEDVGVNWINRAVATAGIYYTFDSNNIPKFFCTQRGIEPFKECWGVPGGYLDYNETIQQGLFRELKEEIGVCRPKNTSNVELYEIDDNTHDEKQTITFRYLINEYPHKEIEYKDTSYKELSKGEILSAKWISLLEIPRYRWAFKYDEILIRIGCDLIQRKTNAGK